MDDDALKRTTNALRIRNGFAAYFLRNQTLGLLILAIMVLTMGLPALFGHPQATNDAHFYIGGRYVSEWLLVASNTRFLFLGVLFVWLWAKHVQLRGPWAGVSVKEKTAVIVAIALICGGMVAFLIAFSLTRGHWPVSGR